MPDQDADHGGPGGADSGDDTAPVLDEQERGVKDPTNDLIAGGWTLFAIAASSYLFVEQGELPLWLAAADFVSIAATSYWAYGRGAFRAAGGFFKKALGKA